MKKKVVFFVLFFVAGSIFAQSPRLYIGGSAGLGPLMGSGGTVLGGNLSPLRVEWQITEYLAVGSGLNFYFAPEAKYTAPKQTDPGSGIFETYACMETHILFPGILKYTYRPSIISFEFGGGLYIAPVVMNTTVERTNDNGYTVGEGYGKDLFFADQNNPFGFVVTSSLGVKIGKGILFSDLSYLRDFSEITVKFKDVKLGNHLWNMLAVNIGYKHGFLPK